MSTRAVFTLLVALAACRSAETREEEDEAPEWAWQVAAYGVDPPGDDAYGSAILRADRGPLHLEARYNYEDLDTGSVFAGRTFAWGSDVELSLVPMIGGVFGSTDGIAPGLELDVLWKALELYVESEYVFDLHDGADDYLFAWSELTVSPLEWLSLGLAGQRTRAREMDLEVDRGFLVGFTWAQVGATAYLFNPDRDDPYGMIGITFDF